MLKKLLPKYTVIEWSLLLAMTATTVIVPIVLPGSLTAMRFPTVFVLFISLMMTAFFWQDPSFEYEGYGVWLFFLIGGPIVAIVGHYAHALHAVILTGVGCAYTAPWSLLRVFLRKRFLSQEHGK